MLSVEEKIELAQKAAKLFAKARHESLTRDEKVVCTDAYYGAPERYLPREFFQWIEDGCPSPR